MDWHTSAPKDELPAAGSYHAENVAVLNTRRTPIRKQPELLLCLVGVSQNYLLGDNEDGILFNLVLALRITIKGEKNWEVIGACRDEVNLLTPYTAIRVWVIVMRVFFFALDMALQDLALYCLPFVRRSVEMVLNSENFLIISNLLSDGNVGCVVGWRKVLPDELWGMVGRKEVSVIRLEETISEVSTTITEVDFRRQSQEEDRGRAEGMDWKKLYTCVVRGKGEKESHAGDVSDSEPSRVSGEEERIGEKKLKNSDLSPESRLCGAVDKYYSHSSVEWYIAESAWGWWGRKAKIRVGIFVEGRYPA
ncbi:hypothetical protein Tco_0574341 [Tanacetum coccineum]